MAQNSTNVYIISKLIIKKNLTLPGFYNLSGPAERPYLHVCLANIAE